MYSSEIAEAAAKRRKTWKAIKKTIVTIFALIFIFVIVALLTVLEENRELKQQNKALTVMITEEREQLPEPVRGKARRLESIGAFKIYHYCPCDKCCGKSNGVTAMGTRAREGETIATDLDVIPMGTTVIIEGHEYIAEDTGSGIHGKRIDIFVETHEEAIKLGIKDSEVFIKK